MWPTNEAETIELYKLAQERLGWRIVHLQTAFPDAIIENRNGAQLVAEFEYLAKNFQNHEHDPVGCDLIICWRNDWPGAPLPVWAIEDTMFPSRRGRGLLCQEIQELKHRCGQLYFRNDDLKRENTFLRDVIKALRAEIEELRAEGWRLITFDWDKEPKAFFVHFSQPEWLIPK